MIDDKERQMVETANKLLDQSADRINLKVSMRLQQARREALSAIVANSEPKTAAVASISFPSWLSPASVSLFAAGMLVIFAVNWLTPLGVSKPELHQYEDVQILSSANDLEMYKNLDFYIWLENENTRS